MRHPIGRVAMALVACGTLAGAAREAGNSAPLSLALPGASPPAEALAVSLRQAWRVRATGYRPRTRHLEPDGRPKYTNRLFLETSPYLRQHAHNPVNWYAWGDEAFEAARRQGRPVLLSVGYSTCHWCHVMEEESFEDEEIARFLNAGYVAIKVDREERPDIDAVYMNAVTALTGRGGWPMTVWLTSDRQPFFGGTYFPARDGDRGVRRGFLTILRELKDKYDGDPQRTRETARELTAHLERSLAGASAGGDAAPDAAVLARAASEYRSRFDAAHGGTQGAPKFPSTFPVRFLLRHHRRTANAAFLDMAVRTLEGMAAGGIHDQIGGGFHRYATDEKWLVPHFEKMLYDNALLAVTYLEAYQATGRADFADVVRDVLDYVAREMTSPEGGFYSATDADSRDAAGHAHEGTFFTWTPAEIERVLAKRDAALVGAHYGITPQGNFEGRTVLHVARSLDDVAKELGVPPGTARQTLENARRALYEARSRRPAPARDEKIIAAWNGLMISAFARAGSVLAEPARLKQAERAAAFVSRKLIRDGRLQRSFKDGRAQPGGFLDDHAFVIAALLDLHEATSAPRYLEEALSLQKSLDQHFRDPEGGYFMTSDDQERLLVREKPAYDGAEPSGSSVALMNLLRFHELTSDDRFRREAERLIFAFSSPLRSAPTSLSEMLLALDFKLGPTKEIVLVAPRSRAEVEPFLAKLRGAFVPNRVTLIAVEGPDLERQARRVPLLRGKVAARGKPTAYVCERGVCQLPTSSPDTFAAQIGK